MDLFDHIFRRFPQRKLKGSISLHFCSAFIYLLLFFLGGGDILLLLFTYVVRVHVLVCVCMCTFMSVGLYLLVYVCNYLCLYAFLYINICLCLWASVFVQLHAFIYNHVCVCASLYENLTPKLIKNYPVWPTFLPRGNLAPFYLQVRVNCKLFLKSLQWARPVSTSRPSPLLISAPMFSPFVFRFFLSLP